MSIDEEVAALRRIAHFHSQPDFMSDVELLVCYFPGNCIPGYGEPDDRMLLTPRQTLDFLAGTSQLPTVPVIFYATQVIAVSSLKEWTVVYYRNLRKITYTHRNVIRATFKRGEEISISDLQRKYSY